MPRKKTVISENYNKPFPERLRTIMAQQEKTQQEVAQALGKTRQAVSYYMDGSSSPDWETLVTLAQYFGVSADWLLGLSDTQSLDTNIQEVCVYTGLSEETVTKLHTFRDCSQVDIISKLLTCSKFGTLLVSIENTISRQNNVKTAIVKVRDKLNSGKLNSALERWRFFRDENSERGELNKAIKNVRYERFEAIDIFTDIVDEITSYRDFDNAVNSIDNEQALDWAVTGISEDKMEQRGSNNG